MLSAAINSLGLVLDIAGVVGLFFYGLPSEVARATAVFETVDENLGKEYDRKARIALAALALGFLLQLVSNFVPGPLGGPSGWQAFATIAVGLLGFSGVCLTLWWNARLAREKSEDERAHERETLARGLAAELRLAREAVERAKQAGLPADDEKLLVPPLTTEIFDRSGDRLGLLPIGVVSPTLNAFLVIKEYDRCLGLFGKLEGQHYAIDAARVAGWSKSSASLIEPINAAIGALDQVAATVR